jgi:hypothetical protein
VRLGVLAAAGHVSVDVSPRRRISISILQETATAQWAEAKSQYRRRGDLIPNLVAPPACDREPRALSRVMRRRGLSPDK